MPSFGPIYIFAALVYLIVIAGILLFLVNIAIAITVYSDAKELKAPALGLGPWVWSLLSFTVPGLGLLVYWLMNHSTLARQR